MPKPSLLKQRRNNSSRIHIEGKRAVIEALRAQVPFDSLLLADNLKRDGQIQDILRKAKHAGIEPMFVPRKKLDEISQIEAHQGVIAYAKPYTYASLSVIIKEANKKAEDTGNALIVIADHITDAGNLGAIIRSAEAFGASAVCIPNVRSAEVSAATYKSSAGALNHIHVARVANIVQVIERFK
ncbi:MAG: RNA methyltransferase, partial [Eggerthellaceae bacterium]|nr:RNA methyltransferase [Eggerthellaceae bacterium]